MPEKTGPWTALVAIVRTAAVLVVEPLPVGGPEEVLDLLDLGRGALDEQPVALDVHAPERRQS